MKDKIAFCEHCLNEFPYIEKDIPTKEVFKGVECEYISKDTFCTNCGKEILVNEVVDSNIYALYDAYRLKTGLISLEDTKTILKKYNIGKRPFSLLLGWGENTYSHYVEGSLPTKQYSDILKKIFYSAKYYNAILENNKANISTAAYLKSKQAVDKLLGWGVTSKSKLFLAANYILNRCRDLTQLSLQKSLYYVQGFYYAFSNKPFFEEDCEAWNYGPVFPSIYQQYKEYGSEVIDKPIIEADYSCLSKLELEVLDSVIENICCYNSSTLVSFTHNEAPWLNARTGYKEDENCDEPIAKESIEEYFKLVLKKYKINKPSDIEVYALACKKENKKILFGGK